MAPGLTAEPSADAAVAESLVENGVVSICDVTVGAVKLMGPFLGATCGPWTFTGRTRNVLGRIQSNRRLSVIDAVPTLGCVPFPP